MADKETLAPLVDRIVELAALPEQAEKKKLWADHQALKGTDRVPLCVYYEGIPGRQWEAMFGLDYIQCRDGLAASIEADLRKRIWMAENVDDDHIVWPTAVIHVPSIEKQGWGVDLGWKHSQDDLGANGYDVPFKDGIDMSQLTRPQTEWDDTAITAHLDRAAELTGDRLTVLSAYQTANHAPFDLAVNMRGMQDLLMDVVLDPAKVHELMEFITAASVAHNQQREAEGRINALSSEPGLQEYGFRVHCAYLPNDHETRPPELKDEWIYVSAQTAAGLGPDHYAEFVQPYNDRIAGPYTHQTVYYHGCERLDHKAEIIKNLPNLRRFHVSPWSSVSKAVEVFRGSVVMEVHDHPGNTFLKSDADQETHLRELVQQAEGNPLDLNISDVHSFNDDPQNLIRWAANARRAAE
ncbi:hypothetical protein ACFL4W_01200 [Planctomycetota bacterium]